MPASLRPHLNAHLLGRPGGRWALNTPALVLDLDAFDRNLVAMADHCRARGIALRPHAKTHKCLAIAHRQIAAGAIGHCCAKLAEAEVFADGGLTSLLLTSPVVTQEGLGRLVALNGRITDLMVVCDAPANAARLSSAVSGAGQTLKVLVDLDVGLGRSGASTVQSAVELAQIVDGAAGLEFCGVQAYAGHVMHIAGYAMRRAASAAALAKVADLRAALTQRGLPPRIITGGGTGTFDIDPDFGVLTDLQAGSYLFMDQEYNEVWTGVGEAVPFEASLFVQTTVISASHSGRCTTDAGCKAFATEAGPPVVASGAPADASYAFFGDEQGLLSFARAGERLGVGDVVVCVTPHCDPTVNLHDLIHVVRDDVLVDIWPIDARGCGQ